MFIPIQSGKVRGVHSAMSRWCRDGEAEGDDVMPELGSLVGDREIVVIANRLPVDRVVEDEGTNTWRTSPGGLVTAMELVVEQLGCRWIGWAGNSDEAL